MPRGWIVSGLFICVLAIFRLHIGSLLARTCAILCVCVFGLWLGWFTLAGTCAIFSVFGLGPILVVWQSPNQIFQLFYLIFHFLVSIKEFSLSLGVFCASAISLNAALIWSLDHVLGIVYFVGNSSFVSETCVAPVLVTLTCQLQKLSFAWFAIKPRNPCLSHVFLWSGRLWIITFVHSRTSGILW